MHLTALLICSTISVAALPLKLKDDLEPTESVQTNTTPTAETMPQTNHYICLKMKSQLDPNGTKITNKLNIGGRKPAAQNIWSKTHLTYRVVNFTPDLPKPDVLSAIKRAFKIWCDVTPLTFKRAFKEKSDIEIQFVTGDHQDNSPFTYTDEQLAHAFAPGPDIGGDIHLNDANNFTNTNQKYNLFLVIAHEIGHSLGLSHSCTYGDLMYASYQSTDVSHFRLPQNDINAIQHLYGPSPNRKIQLTGPTTPSICEDNIAIDAVTTLRGDLFLFSQRFVWRKHPETPQPELEFIQTYWPFLPNNVDAAYENPFTETIIIFRKNKFWSFLDLNLEKQGEIYEYGFPRSVKSIDAAVCVTDKTYFFVNDKYWRYDEGNQTMDIGFPRNIEDDFPGIPPRISGAMFFRGSLYIFTNEAQYEFCLDTMNIKQVLSIKSWMGCKSK